MNALLRSAMLAVEGKMWTHRAFPIKQNHGDNIGMHAQSR